MGSTRLPGKVLMPVLGRPMLWHVVRRTGQARLVDQVVVATTRGVADQAIVSLCEAEGWAWFRGSEEDLLDRYYQAALSYQAGIVVRITADCPLIDPAVVDQVVAAFLQAQPLDYASNTLPPPAPSRGDSIPRCSPSARWPGRGKKTPIRRGASTSPPTSTKTRENSVCGAWPARKIIPPCAGRWTGRRIWLLCARFSLISAPGGLPGKRCCRRSPTTRNGWP